MKVIIDAPSQAGTALTAQTLCCVAVYSGARWIRGPLELSTWVSGKLFFPLLAAPLFRPLLHAAKILKISARGFGCVRRARFLAAGVWVKNSGAGAGAESALGRVPARCWKHRCFLPGPARRPGRASRRLCVRVSEEGITQRERLGRAGRGVGPGPGARPSLLTFRSVAQQKIYSLGGGKMPKQ